jgi:hypothetical protein
MDTIIQESHREKCEFTQEIIKKWLIITNENAFISIKNFLTKNKLFDLSQVNYSDISPVWFPIILQQNTDRKTICLYDSVSKKQFWEIQDWKKINRNITLSSLITWSVLEISTEVNIVNPQSFDCEISQDPEHQSWTNYVIDENRIKESQENNKEWEKNQKIESEKYEVKSWDTLFNIIKHFYWLKFNQSILDVLKKVVDYNANHHIDLSYDTPPPDWVPGDKLQTWQTIYLPKDHAEILSIQDKDRERRIHFNKKNNIKMKNEFK